jgi:thiol:disulfide interchange protein DsbD
MAAVLLAFALNMSGVFEFALRATALGGDLQQKQGLAGSFFTGVLATVVATPCSAPFLAPALGAALALPVASSFAVFTAIALGLAAPYLVLAAFPAAVRALPRPGAWMEGFKQGMAFLLYGTVGLLLWILAGQLEGDALLSVVLALTALAFALWLYGRATAPGARDTVGRKIRFALALALAGGAVAYGWPRAAAPTDLVWEPWSAERVAELRAEGRPIYVDFTARWCFTCQTNKKAVFAGPGSGEVLKTFRERRVATLRADWTNRDPLITAELKRWERAAVPFNLIYLPGAAEPAVLPELLTPSIVLDALGR